MSFQKIHLAMLTGAAVGFTAFVISVGSIGGVFFRPDTDGKKVFTIQGFKKFLTAPLNPGPGGTNIQYRTVWAKYPELKLKDKLELWSMNWLITTAAGAVVGAAIMITVWCV